MPFFVGFSFQIVNGYGKNVETTWERGESHIQEWPTCGSDSCMFLEFNDNNDCQHS